MISYRRGVVTYSQRLWRILTLRCFECSQHWTRPHEMECWTGRRTRMQVEPGDKVTPLRGGR